MRHPPYLAPARSPADVRSGLRCKEGGKPETVEGSWRGQGEVRGRWQSRRHPGDADPLKDAGQPPGLGDVKGSGRQEGAGARGRGHV